MRGQKLFVRPIEPGDAETIRLFFAANTTFDAVPTCGLIGKLLGQTVAVMSIDFSEADAVHVEDLLVARELRRKRVGRVMMNELELIAAKMERDWLIAEASTDAREFLRRVGFVEDGNRMVRRVQR